MLPTYYLCYTSLPNLMSPNCARTVLTHGFYRHGASITLHDVHAPLTDIDRTDVHVRFATAKQSQGRHSYITYGKRDLQLCSPPLSLSSLTYSRHGPKHVNAGATARIGNRHRAYSKPPHIHQTRTHLPHENCTPRTGNFRLYF